MAHVRRVINEAFPDLVPIFGAHGDYGGHRAPRDHDFLSLAGRSRELPLERRLPYAQDIRTMVAEANRKRK